MTKKIVVLGRGTAGSQAIIHFLRHLHNCEIEWHYDPNIPTQAVGEGSVLTLARNMFENLNFNYMDLDKVDGTIKTGIYKSGWGNDQPDFLHSFPPPNVSLHFNARGLQNYIYDQIKDRVKVVEHNIKSTNIDSDLIIDCSGKPENFDDFNIPSYIPVNSVHVTQCYWEYPRFQHTLTIARPYGWVFGIPLKNRCSIGYLYNNNINTLDEVKEDVKNIFSHFDLNPSNDTNSFTFGNYYRKKNYDGKIIYNGNASFFLEPLEATSVGVMDHIQRVSCDLWYGNFSEETANLKYKQLIEQIECVIMLHYFAGSKYKTNFWDFAKERAVKCIENASKDINFIKVYTEAKTSGGANLCPNNSEYGLWHSIAFNQNIKGLGIEQSLDNLVFGSGFDANL
jgi:hypothetical protein